MMHTMQQQVFTKYSKYLRTRLTDKYCPLEITSFKLASDENADALWDDLFGSAASDTNKSKINHNFCLN